MLLMCAHADLYRLEGHQIPATLEAAQFRRRVTPSSWAVSQTGKSVSWMSALESSSVLRSQALVSGHVGEAPDSSCRPC